jgi:hypothetical protein
MAIRSHRLFLIIAALVPMPVFAQDGVPPAWNQNQPAPVMPAAGWSGGAVPAQYQYAATAPGSFSAVGHPAIVPAGYPVPQSPEAPVAGPDAGGEAFAQPGLPPGALPADQQQMLSQPPAGVPPQMVPQPQMPFQPVMPPPGCGCDGMGACSGACYGGDCCGGALLGGCDMPLGYSMCGDGCDACCGGCECAPSLCDPCRPLWYFRGDAVWLRRDKPNNRNLTFFHQEEDEIDESTNDRFILKTDDLSFDSASGMKLTLGRYVTARTAIEGSFYGTHDWSARTSTPAFPHGDSGGPLFPYWGTGPGAFNTTAFTNASQHIATAKTSFDSAELGVRHWFSPTASIMGGFRFLRVADNFELFSFDDEDLNPDNVGFYRIHTSNKLFGAQIGSEYTHPLAPWLFCSAEAKAGVYGNAARQRNTLFNSDTTDDSRDDKDVEFARVIDVSLSLTAIVSNNITIRGGYNLLFINGVALATDQLDTSPIQNNSREGVADKGSITLYGPFVGGEIVW